MKIYPHVTGLSWADPPDRPVALGPPICLPLQVRQDCAYIRIRRPCSWRDLQERPAKVCLKFHASLQHRLR